MSKIINNKLNKEVLKHTKLKFLSIIKLKTAFISIKKKKMIFN